MPHTLRWYPDSKAHGANMGPIWRRQDPRGPHVGPMNHAICVVRIYTCVYALACEGFGLKCYVFAPRSVRSSSHKMCFPLRNFELCLYNMTKRVKHLFCLASIAVRFTHYHLTTILYCFIFYIIFSFYTNVVLTLSIPLKLLVSSRRSIAAILS